MKLLQAGLCALLLHGCAAESEERLQPSGYGAYIPQADDSFEFYVEENIRRIQLALDGLFVDDPAGPFLGDYTPEAVALMRAPYEIRPDTSCAGPSMGFLLIHGLTDSPYLLKPLAASLAERYPCALLRGVLLPGHGTVPGDSLEMDYSQWQEVTAFGVESFRGEVDALYLAGFSTGSSLSVDYVASHRDDPLPAGIIMLSPALRASTSAAALAPYLRRVRDWLSVQPDEDAAKYESFSVNAAAEFYLLARGLGDIEPLNLPVFMALSGDDSTVDGAAALDFFCDKTPVGMRQMIWYEADITASVPPRRCDGLAVEQAAHPEYRFVSYAHTSITMPPNDRHYGADARYRNCVHYDLVDDVAGRADTSERRQCQTDEDRTVYGEHTVLDKLPPDALLRRATFNPAYDQMVSAIGRFIEQAQTSAP